MIKDAVKKIEDAVQKIKTIEGDKKAELLSLLATLKSEIEQLSTTHEEHARNIAGFAQKATRVVADKRKSAHDLGGAIENLASSVAGLEASHPKLVETINGICIALAHIGV